MVFGGDFRQVLPVLPRRTQQEAVDASLVSSYVWPILIKFTLEENIRAKEDPRLVEFLLQLGNGELQQESVGFVGLPPNCCIPFDLHNDNFEELVVATFPDLEASLFDPMVFTDRRS